ncbi:MJ1255/VC2487 family glycosyltransferase [Glaciecola sp. SC05]|uniref:MJ1255/VC2487 family glycosyltransferase n=1 Tax=Glaciecola sp. SC05 TaxID=1987355 RepID=UPI003526F56C
MKILYGVQGTGNGHITRARHMAEGFARRNDIQVDYLFSGRKPNGYFDMQSFGNYQTSRGLTFVTNNGRVQKRQTIAHNNVFYFATELKQRMVKNYDLIINDFEPISAWAGKLSGVPSLSVSHQAAFLHQVPKHKQSLLDKAITQYFAPTQYSLGTHWYHFGHQIIPPFVARQCSKQTIEQAVKPINIKSKAILVYLPFEDTQLITEQLNDLSDYLFICYHPAVTHAYYSQNIHWRPLSTKAFKQDLVNCTGVIANCGFELSTECLSLGKALLVKPLQGQYEQSSNAYTLQTLGLCEVMHDLNSDEIDEWLQCKQGIKIDYPSNCDSFIDWIAEGDWQAPEAICKSLWQQVRFPDSLKDKLKHFQTAIE